jgi:monoterpene epsilon-lactone hydrolase
MSDLSSRSSRIFDQLESVDLHTIPWAWAVKKVPPKAKYWLLNRLFLLWFGFMLACVWCLRSLGLDRTAGSLSSRASMLIFKSISKLNVRPAIGNIERFRRSVLRIISPSKAGDLVAVDASQAIDPMTKPEYVWIAHQSLTPEHFRRYVFYVHGGGFVKGDLAAFHHVCCTMSRELDALICFPVYPLCPESSLPDTIAQLMNSYQRVAQDVPGWEPVVMADSAGGLLAVLMLQAMEHENLSSPNALVLLSPLLDVNLSSPSIVDNQDTDPIVGVDLIRELCDIAKEGVELEEISIDPAALRHFPRTYVVASEDEILRDDSRWLQTALSQSNVPIEAVYWPGMCHAFPLLFDHLPEARRAIADIRAWLDRNNGR